MKSLLLIIFLANLTIVFSQKDGNPFNLPPHLIKEHTIKSISEYNGDGAKVEYAIYDQTGNQIYHEEEDRIIQSELEYDEKGHLKKEVVIGLEHEVLLKKRPIYNDLGKIDSIIYELPVAMYYSGFVEKYSYDKDGRIKTINVYSVPEHRLMFQHDYRYASGFRNQLLEIRTFVEEAEGSITFYTEKFTYYRNGNVKKTSQLTPKGDIIAINYFDDKGRLISEVMLPFYTTPSSSMYDADFYSEALDKVQTPLTPFIICRNLNRENYQGTELFQIDHEYDKGKLLKSTKRINYQEGDYLVSTDTYKYNDQNKLAERVTISTNNQDTSTVRFSYDPTQRYIHLSEKTRSYLVVRKEADPESSSEELIIEAFLSSWECKTLIDFDSISNTVTKKRFCLDDENQYPSEPEQITVANFDSSGRQLKEDTFFGANKASKNTTFIYADNGDLVIYENNGQYWKYVYNANDSTLVRQECYKDSLYEMLAYHYTYNYDDFGNYTINLVYENGTKVSPFAPVFQKYDSAGRVLKKEWIAVEEYSARTISFTYADHGLCIESIFSQWGEDEITRYEYEFY